MTDYTDLVNWLRDNAMGVVSFRPKFIEAANAIEEQAARIAELEAALRPFAAAADLYTDETMWSHPVKEYLDRFRSARAALNTKGE